MPDSLAWIFFLVALTSPIIWLLLFLWIRKNNTGRQLFMFLLLIYMATLLTLVCKSFFHQFFFLSSTSWNIVSAIGIYTLAAGLVLLRMGINDKRRE